jgi:polysaccharide biosynthesis protein PelF
MSDWEFTVMNFLSNSNSNGNYTVPANVRSVIEFPMYGTNRYEEFYNDHSSLLTKIARTNNSVIENKFVPIFTEFLSNTISGNFDTEKFSDHVSRLHYFFQTYDAKKCLEHLSTWDAFADCIRSDPIYRHMPMKSALTTFQMFQRSTQLLSIEIPSVDIIHCSLAWLPSLVGIVGKIELDCPLILTEHGVAFRELMLYQSSYLLDESSKIFSKIMTRNVVSALYSKADVITPVCNANTGWEKMLGVDESKIRVIYNGVDTNRFRPLPMPKPPRNPMAVFVGRVDGFKDIVCLVTAISMAKRELPALNCRIFGGALDLEYSERCIKAVRHLGLQDSVKFMGPVKQPEKAYALADVVVCSSISEGFPFAVIEAMSCGKAVVASDVGGVREALDGCGVLVRSRRPSELAAAIVTLIKNDKLRNDLGLAAMRRARQKFTIEQSIQNYRILYEELLERKEPVSVDRKVITV